ncbi:MAG: type II toxin-antitoxin system RelB/DinJ family antitoxin [Nitrospirota bacterium]
MNKTAVIQARVHPGTKKKAETILKKLGITPTEAIRLFYVQIGLQGGLPFPVLIPNELTKKTLEKSSKGKEIQKFDSTNSIFEGWEE